jgi:[ribosomal protein S5]-alanine N-acetyltransferase
LIPVDNSTNMQLGYALLPKAWGKGYATELTKEGLKYVFGKTGLQTIYAYTEGPNLSSQKVLMKSGFKHSCNKTEGGKEVCEFILTKAEFEAMQVVSC